MGRQTACVYFCPHWRQHLPDDRDNATGDAGPSTRYASCASPSLPEIFLRAISVAPYLLDR